MPLIDISHVPTIVDDTLGFVWSRNIVPLLDSLLDNFRGLGASTHFGVELPEVADQRVPGTLFSIPTWLNPENQWIEATNQRISEILYSQINPPGEPIFKVWSDRVAGFQHLSEPVAGIENFQAELMTSLRANSLNDRKRRKKGIFLAKDGTEDRVYRRWPPRAGKRA